MVAVSAAIFSSISAAAAKRLFKLFAAAVSAAATSRLSEVVAAAGDWLITEGVNVSCSSELKLKISIFKI